MEVGGDEDVLVVEFLSVALVVGEEVGVSGEGEEGFVSGGVDALGEGGLGELEIRAGRLLVFGAGEVGEGSGNSGEEYSGVALGLSLASFGLGLKKLPDLLS